MGVGNRPCDPGASRRASLKQRRFYVRRDPGASRRASLKRVRNREQSAVARRVDPGASRRASLKLPLVPMDDPGDSRDPGASRRASL